MNYTKKLALPQIFRRFASKRHEPLPAERLLKMHGLVKMQDSTLPHVGGERCYVLLGDAARLERALISWTLARLINDFNFTPVVVPTLIYDDIISACGFDPHGERTQVFSVDGFGGSRQEKDTKDNDQRWSLRDVCLAGTSEIPLVSLHIGKTFDVDSEAPIEHLPKRYCAVSRCYRAEVSRSEKGLYRLHYFSKVEMVALVRPEDSAKTLDEFVSIQQSLFSDLGLKYQTREMPKEDLSPVAVKKFDVEALFPTRQSYGEISSASNCSSNQCKSLNISFRRLKRDDEPGESPFIQDYVHSVNGTACASPRILLPLIETHQTPERRIRVPDVLVPAMNGQEYLSKLSFKE